MIAVIDYGAGNLRSITRALQVHGATVEVTADLARVRAADRLVLPGVGNAKAAMERLVDTGLADALREGVASGQPLLGICLGMQLLFGAQEEGPTTGLGLLEGTVRRLSGDVQVPHMGWNTVTFAEHSPFRDMPPGAFYFVHSYAVHPHAADIAAETEYGMRFPSMVVHNHIWGTQFHPEKSGDNGLRLLSTWLDWTP